MTAQEEAIEEQRRHPERQYASSVDGLTVGIYDCRLQTYRPIMTKAFAGALWNICNFRHVPREDLPDNAWIPAPPPSHNQEVKPT